MLDSRAVTAATSPPPMEDDDANADAAALNE
jgi:hypothetical protein